MKSNGIYTHIWDDVSRDNWFNQYFHSGQQTTNTTDIQQNFIGDFKIGNMQNRLLAALSLAYKFKIKPWSTGVGSSVSASGFFILKISVPADKVECRAV